MMKTLFGIAFGGITGLLLGILIGAAAFGAFTFVQSGGTSIPYNMEHNNIAGMITAIDTTTQFGKTTDVQLQIKHMQTTEATYASSYAFNMFTSRQTYTHSLWTVCSDGGDIDATITIWGPGNDGKTYQIEFGRHTAAALEFHIGNTTLSWSFGTNIGYASLPYTIP